MSTFVLVHGAWHGGWCWYKVVVRLARAGHRALAPDLLGLCTARRPASDVTLDGWVAQICALIEPEPEPVVLVGHSRGGIVVGGVAERMPERIARLVYLAAAMPRDGQSMLDAIGGAPPVALTGQIARGPEDGTMVVADAAIEPAFYGDCSDEDVALAKLLLTPEPMAASATPVRISAERWGRVPRDYIECLRDQAIHIDAQRAMHSAFPGTRVLAIDSDHSPFFSHPDALVSHLLA